MYQTKIFFSINSNKKIISVFYKFFFNSWLLFFVIFLNCDFWFSVILRFASSINLFLLKYLILFYIKNYPSFLLNSNSLSNFFLSTKFFQSIFDLSTTLISFFFGRESINSSNPWCVFFFSLSLNFFKSNSVSSFTYLNKIN